MKTIGAILISICMLSATDFTLNRELILPLKTTFDVDNQSREYEIKPGVGIELFRKKSGDRGDYLTENYQLRFSYDVTGETPEESWALEVHNLWWEFKLSLGKRLRVGHLQPHFGLESSLDTHGKLFQTLAMQSMGLKHDWGFAYKQYVGNLDAAASFTLGNGMSIHSYDNNYLGTIRLSTSDKEQFRAGFSMLYGSTVNAMVMKTFPQPMKMGKRERVLLGFDGRFQGLHSELLFETYLGSIDEKLAGGLMVRTDIPSKDKLLFHIQGDATYAKFMQGNTTKLGLFAGLDITLLKNLTLESKFGANYNYSMEKATPSVAVQLYYFGD